MLDMFVVERLNLLVKHVSEAIDNTRHWNYSVLASVLTNQCNLLSESRHMTPGLVGKCVAWPQDPSVTLARRVSAFGKDFQNRRGPKGATKGGRLLRSPGGVLRSPGGS